MTSIFTEPQTESKFVVELQQMESMSSLPETESMSSLLKTELKSILPTSSMITPGSGPLENCP
jgi:hypothetical protein